MKVVIQPCGLADRSVRDHYISTVHSPVSIDSITPFLRSQDFTALTNALAGRELRLWGVMPGPRNDSMFSKLEAGDFGYFSGDKLLFETFRVLYVFPSRQPELARHLWGDHEGKSWEHMYAIGDRKQAAVSNSALRKALAVKSSNWFPRSFMVHEGQTALRLHNLPSREWSRRSELFVRYGLEPDPRDRDGASSVASRLGRVERSHVLAALQEYDELGESNFLKKYGFEASRRYWLVFEGRRYASKAILGAAAGFIPGETALKASEFSGGLAETLRILKKLGFQASSTLGQLKVGDWHEDRRVISALYGGNPQAGITRFPDGHPSLFSHHNGPYEDERPSTEHDFVYRGQGATGTQTLSSGGNKLLEHARKTQLACRFWHQGTDGRFTFFAWVAVVGRTWVPVQKDGAIVGHQISWILQPVPSPDVREWPERAQAATAAEEAADTDDDVDDMQPPATPQSYADLCDDIDRRPPRSGRRRQRPARNDYERSEKARRAVRQRATACENPACTGMPPDVGTDGGPLLDVDHVRPLSKGGADHPSNMIAICPNCHRAKTFGQRAREWEQSFAGIAARLHKELYGRMAGFTP